MTISAQNKVLTLQNVDFSYGETPILSKIDLEIFDGEFLGIVGPNAGGKTTLLKLVLGQLQPVSGRIRVLGQSPRTASRSLGYVPQYPSFPRDFPISVEQLVLQGRIGMGKSKLLASFLPGKISQADRDAARKALTEVEADNIASRQISSLSGGQLQRVLLARALVSEPAILILDEPTANIDQRLESEIFDLLKLLNERMTILVVSHDIAFISQYVSRVACINTTLVCHHTDKIDGSVIQELYGEHVRMISHGHSH